VRELKVAGSKIDFGEVVNEPSHLTTLRIDDPYRCFAWWPDARKNRLESLRQTGMNKANLIAMRKDAKLQPVQLPRCRALGGRLPLALLITCFSFSDWVKAAEDPKRGQQAETKALTLQKQIRAEIATRKGPSWAGEYYNGDGLGVNVSLLLAPRSGYLFEWHGCLGLYDRNYGAVTETNGQLRLSFAFENKRKGFQGVAEQLIPILAIAGSHLEGLREVYLGIWKGKEHEKKDVGYGTHAARARSRVFSTGSI
jgi:hypothetical protein